MRLALGCCCCTFPNPCKTHQAVSCSLLCCASAYQPHTDYIPTTYWPHTNPILTTYQPHTGHIPTTYWQHMNHIPTTYWPHTVPTTYWQHMDHIPTTYCTNHILTTYEPHTDHTVHIPTRSACSLLLCKCFIQMYFFRSVSRRASMSYWRTTSWRAWHGARNRSTKGK